MYSILVFNAGSSSLKYAVYEVSPDARFARYGVEDNLRSEKIQNNIGEIFKGHVDNHGKSIKNFKPLVATAIKECTQQIKFPIKYVGHRVVHGGTEFIKPTRVTQSVLKKIQALSELAPLHNPANCAVIEAALLLLPQAVHTAIFDTAFHATMPQAAYTYPLPEKLRKAGIQRYGFHGISHSYVFAEAQKKLGTKQTARTVSCHLGNGCSVTAIANGAVIDTSMGFTPLEGIPMGTRSGDIDAGIIFHLAHLGMKLSEIEKIVLNESGLKGLSGFSGDVRDLRAAQLGKNVAQKKSANLALSIFAYKIAKYIGAYATIMGGLDCLIFTAGTGENAWYLRKMIINLIKPFKSAQVVVIKTDEERKIAEECVHGSK